MILDPTIRSGGKSVFEFYATGAAPFSCQSSCIVMQGLGILKQKFPSTPVLALTATATASVKEDVVRALALVNCIIFRQSFNRPNLWFASK